MRLRHSGALTPSLGAAHRCRVRQLTHSGDEVELTFMLDAAVNQTLTSIPGTGSSGWLWTKPIMSWFRPFALTLKMAAGFVVMVSITCTTARELSGLQVLSLACASGRWSAEDVCWLVLLRGSFVIHDVKIFGVQRHPGLIMRLEVGAVAWWLLGLRLLLLWAPPNWVHWVRINARVACIWVSLLRSWGVQAMGLWMESTVVSGLLLRLSTLPVDPAVLQVFCGYETIHACRDWRRTDRRVSSLGGYLLFRECFVVGMETVIAIVVVYFDAGIVAVLLWDSFYRAIQLVHGLWVGLQNLGRMVNGLYVLKISIVAEGTGL